jgi:geranylgeranyl diphosphate synthase type II
MAFQYLSKCNPSKHSQIIPLFSTTALGVCEGQQYDMEFEERDQVPIPDYLEMIRLKTAVLIACSLQMGAILAGANEKSSKLLYDFGIKIGIAFQLQDDWLDVYGDEQTFGKQIGGDICENKKTFILLKAMEMSDETDRSILMNWIKKTDFEPKEKIRAVREIFTRSGAGQATKTLMRQYHDQAMESLNQLSIPESDKLELRNFAGSVVERVK